jgi:hypothetical protein
VGCILEDMEQAATSTSSPTSPSFANLLAALATPVPKSAGAPSDESLTQGKKPALNWNDDGLEDDVITLSYERALRANARYHPPEATELPLPPAANPEPARLEQAAPAVSAAASPALAHPAASAEPAKNPTPETSRSCSTALERNLKEASITIRMSRAECAQLHQRAAEAGLTVSAYLRSCAFETESLRAMVKDTLDQLRSATAQAKPAIAHRSRLRELAHWLTGLVTPWRGAQRVAQA